MLYTDTFIGKSVFLFLGAIDIDTIYFRSIDILSE